MKRWIYKHRFLMMRRFSQLGVLALYGAANWYGLKILMGNLSSSLFFEKIPLADPFALLQMLAAGAMLGLDVIMGGLIIVAFYMILGGRAFCSWVCPVNMITDSANWLRRVLYFEKIEKKVWQCPDRKNWIRWM